MSIPLTVISKQAALGRKLVVAERMQPGEPWDSVISGVGRVIVVHMLFCNKLF